MYDMQQESTPSDVIRHGPNQSHNCNLQVDGSVNILVLNFENV